MQQAIAATEQKAKRYIRYQKIATFKEKFIKTEKGMRPGTSVTLTAFEKEKAIAFTCRGANHVLSDKNKKSKFVTIFAFTLSMYKNKKGDTRFKLYRVGQNGNNSVRTSKPEEMRQKLVTFLSSSQRQYKKPLPASEVMLGLRKTQLKRLYRFVTQFLKRHGVSYKYLSKDPFVLMTQLCYPGTQMLDDETLRQSSVGSFFLDDPLKLTLRTKGKKSRKLLYEVLKHGPKGSQSIMRMLKYVRMTRSLDHAQKLMELLMRPREYPYMRAVRPMVSTISVDESVWGEYAIHKLTAKQMKIFDPVSLESLADCVCNRGTLRDTFMMIGALERGNPGFNFAEIEYKTMKELHDLLSQMRNNERGMRGVGQGRHPNIDNFFLNANGVPKEKHVFPETSVQVIFGFALQSNFWHRDYTIVYARDSDELAQQAKAMINCSAFYDDQLAANDYAIFCVAKKETGELVYMFGFNAYKSTLDATEPNKKLAVLRYGQGVAIKNGRIPQNEMLELTEKIYGAFGYTFNENDRQNPYDMSNAPLIAIPVETASLPKNFDPRQRFGGTTVFDGDFRNLVFQNLQARNVPNICEDAIPPF